MRNLSLTAFAVLLMLSLSTASAQQGGRWPAARTGDEDQAFHKGCIIISLTEGISSANYGVKTIDKYVMNSATISGDHDPLYIEYGFSRRWSAGLYLGTDLFTIDPSKYGYTTSTGKVQVFMSDASLILSHHYIVSRKLDLSDFIGMGVSAVTINGSDGDTRYHYNSDGYVWRGGFRFAYYFWQGWGATAIVNGFTNYNSSKNFKGNTFGKDYLTEIKGGSWELGLCKRFM